jgi:hypothetical protein
MSHLYLEKFLPSTDVKETDSPIEKADGKDIYCWRLNETGDGSWLPLERSGREGVKKRTVYPEVSMFRDDAM